LQAGLLRRVGQELDWKKTFVLRICHLRADQAPITGICPLVPGLHIVDLPRLLALVIWSLHQQTAKAWKRQVSCGCPSERCACQSSTPYRIAAYCFCSFAGGEGPGPRARSSQNVRVSREELDVNAVWVFAPVEGGARPSVCRVNGISARLRSAPRAGGIRVAGGSPA